MVDQGNTDRGAKILDFRVECGGGAGHAQRSP